MTPGNNSHNIFISHTHADKAIADAFRDAVGELFGSCVTVSYSTDTEHGPKHGGKWLQWIDQQVKSSDFTLVFLTPSSLQKPWILWEAGAVAGTSVVAGKDDARKVRPLVFRIPPGQVPDPFRDIQLVRGDDSIDMQAIFLDWMSDLPAAVSGKAGMKLESTLKKYISAVEHALDNAPLVPTEAVVQEWILRLDDLRLQNRMSEVRSVHDWLNIAFGREQGDKPLDVRLHRRLGELYLNAKNYDEAIDQFELARQSSPRDILILRELGRAYLGAAEKGSDKANQRTREIIQIIEKLDPDAFERNVECTALKGRWLRQRDPSAARDVYRKAFQRNPKSYYVGDLLGQMELQLKEIDSARNTYRQVLDIINSLGERNLWVQATAANAAIVACAQPTVIREKLSAIREFRPSPENLRTIEDGLRRIQRSLGSDESVFKDWVAALRQ